MPTQLPDTLVFVNGEALTGELIRANGDTLTFKSAMAGELTVKWSNVKELSSYKRFAVITKSVKLTRRDAGKLVSVGTVRSDARQLTIDTAAPIKTIAVADMQVLIDAAAFDKGVNHPPNLLRGWGGVASGGVSLLRATQNATTFTGAVNLVRATPGVDWLPARDRTSLDYNQAYGTVSQTGAPTAKTNIFHADAERDEYISPRLFVFGSATFDHNFSQSLNLQQAYGGGIGITLQKSAQRQLDFKGDVHYEKQAFINPAQNVNLFGSTFSEKYLRYLRKGLVFNEFASISPSWTSTDDYSAHVNASLGFPVFKGLGFNIGGVDDYLNNAPAGFKKNSTQFITGITYTIKPR